MLLVWKCGGMEVWKQRPVFHTSIPPHFYTPPAIGAIRTLTDMVLSHAPLPVGVRVRKPTWSDGVVGQGCSYFTTPSHRCTRYSLALGVELRFIPNGNEVGRFAETGGQERVQDALALNELVHGQFDPR